MISASIAFDVICTDQIPMSGIRNLTKRDLAMFGSHDMTINSLDAAFLTERRTRLPLSQLQFRSQPLRQTFQLTLTLLLPWEIPLASSSSMVKALVATQQQTPSCRILLTVPDLLLEASRPSRQVFHIILSCLFPITCLGRKPDIPGGSFWEPGAQLVKSLSAEKARELLTNALSQDPTTFMAALEKRN